MRKILLLAVSCIFFLTGCSPSYSTFDAAPGYSKYQASANALIINEKSPKGSISITLLMPEKCGCYFEKANDRKEIDDEIAYQCIGIPLYTDELGKEMKQKAKADDAKAMRYYVFESFSEITKTCLEKQLGAYFNQVEIKLDSPVQKNMNEISSGLSYYSKWGLTNDLYILVKLIAKSSDGEIIEANGKTSDKLGNGHMAWYFPVSILTFPVGWMISLTILENNHDGLVNKTIANAIDLAAAELSKKIAVSLAQNPGQSYEVYVMLE